MRNDDGSDAEREAMVSEGAGELVIALIALIAVVTTGVRLSRRIERRGEPRTAGERAPLKGVDR